MESIKNKKAYWGRYTFEAISKIIKSEEFICLNVYRNLPYKLDNSFLIKTKEDLIDINSILGIGYYTGYLGGMTHKKIKGLSHKSKKEVIIETKVPTIDLFIKAFRFEL